MAVPLRGVLSFSVAEGHGSLDLNIGPDFYQNVQI